MSGGGPGGGLRVMIVTDQYEPMVGGVPTVTRELARGLADRGHAVLVVAPGASGRGLTSGGRPAGGRVALALPGSVRWPWYEGQRLGLLSTGRARELIAAVAPDVVHVHSPLTLGLTARSAARRCRVPVVYTNHYLPANAWPAASAATSTLGEPGGGLAGVGARVFDAAFYACVTGFANRCDRVTAPTVTALRLLRDHGLRAPSQVVSNGIDLDTFSPGPGPGPDQGPGEDQGARELRARHALPDGRPLVLAVGRLSPEKRADVLIEAAALLAARDRDRSPLLILAGTGPDEARLRALAAHRGIAGNVRFVGFVPDADLPGLYRLADVFAIASPVELQSLVTMEAMASGLPVVAVGAGALGELVHAGENGFLVRPGASPHGGPAGASVADTAADTAADLADCLDLLCRDPALRARMSKASRRIITGHDHGRVLARWESIYRELAAPGRPGQPPPPAPAAQAQAEPDQSARERNGRR